MSDHDRGAYTPPTDAPLSFDARQPVRGSRPAPMMLVISAIVLVVLVVAIVLIYRSGAREAGDPPQTVGSPVGEMKTAPAPEDQPVDPATGLQIYRSEDGAPAPAQPNFVPPPEEPQARPEPQLRPTAPVTSQPAPPAQPAPTPAPAAKAPAPAPVAKAPEPKASTPTPAAVASGGAMVQVGAFSSEALADAGWNDAMRALPDSAAGKGKRVEPVESNGKTLYRGYVTGFSSRAEASAYCDRLKAAGRSCFVR
ncbi:MAG: SPOR domain-containing protein [Phenylobacterium sp.]|uniref:cell division protein FtsN n=1 Tax=Phenylobacterium sp. TaxID=1871053 RepID=UPI002737279B|nr:SPOR domain-containing protein [Phenylobacterium sp.]MDP1643165.1 SPOR domain-containing protein [Phenylobacterium sp.]MDP3117531.1 SPOR domain-containing protein [Phenylobacterium sp.]MDP3384890.1 SPOR domain-containing protein [Phenylobacterium sp.]